MKASVKKKIIYHSISQQELFKDKVYILLKLQIKR